MKKIFYSFLAVACLLVFAACSKDELIGTHQLDNSIQINTQKLDFDAQGGQGTVTFEAMGSTTVTSSAEWCHVTSDGKTINVTVDENKGYDSRNAVITIASATAKRTVAAVQKGIVIIFAYETYTTDSVGVDGTTFRLEAESTDPIECSSNVEWIKATVVDGKVNIVVDANTEPKKRTGKVTIVAPEHDNKAVITIPQKAAEAQPVNLSGEYSMTFYKSSTLSDANKKTINVTIEKDAKDKTLYYLVGLFADDAAYAPLNFKLPFVYDEEQQTLTMTNCTVIGNDGTYYIAPVYNYATSSSANSTSYSVNNTRDIIFNVKSVDKKYEFTAHPADASHISNGFLIGRFDNNTTFTKDTRKSVQGYVRDAVLIQK